MGFGPMTRLVLLQAPIGSIARVRVHPTAGRTDAAIAAATGLRLDQVAGLYFDDRDAILNSMTSIPRKAR
jgi:hypothetical protein